MARYELQDGTSSKFWEIEIEDRAFTVRWGRIGTRGQSQVKSFPTAAKAQAEHDKLVREKTGKGYRPVGAARASRPAAAAAPAVRGSGASVVTPPAPVTTGMRVAWTDSGRRRVHPRPGTGFKAPRVDVGKRFGEIAGRFREMSASLAAGERSASPDCLALMRAIARRLAKKTPEPPLSVEEEAACAALQAAWYGPQGDGFAEYWSGVAGVAFAVDALATSWGFDRQDSFDPKGKRTYVLARQKPRDEAFAYGRTFGWRTLRRQLAGADPAAWQAARAVAERHRAKAPLPLRTGLAYLFPSEEPWVREVTQEHLGTRDVEGYATMLLGALADPGLAARFAKRLTAGHLSAEMVETPGQEYAATLVDALGPAAFAPLRTLFALADSAASRRALADGLAQLEGEEVAALFRPLVEDRLVKGIVNDYFLRHPHLRERAGAGSSPPSRSEPAPIATLSAAAVSAGTGSLPAVLASPPWLGPRQEPKVVTGLSPLAHEERFRLSDGERTRFSEEGEKGKDRGWALAEIRKGIAGSGQVNFFFVLRVPPRQALEVVLEYPPSAWYGPETSEILAFAGRAAHAGLDPLDALQRLAEGHPAQALPVLARFDSPRAAPRFADALVRLRRLRGVAETWLTDHPRAAAVGLVPAAVGSQGRARECANAALRYLSDRGHGGLLRSVAASYGVHASAALEEALSRDPRLLFPARLPKLPGFFRAEALPRPALRSGGQVPLDAVSHLGTMLAFSTLDAPYAGLADVKDACSPASLSAFAWGLFESWQSAGAPPKEAWAFLALGHLGDDETVRRLAPMLRAWPGEGASARAALGLDVLTAIGTDLALMQLHAISQRAPARSLREAAGGKIRAVAESRGLTDEELGDRLVPDLGLLPDGSRLLDFGSRTFRVGFDEGLRPFVKDASGRRLPDLPKPGKGDDATVAAELGGGAPPPAPPGARGVGSSVAAAAVDSWKALKKDARAVAADQLHRLERALVERRRWSLDTWRSLLLAHPLLVHLVRRLVWGTYEADGRLEHAFRVAEDSSLATVDDSPFAPAAGTSIGLVHPIELAEAEVSRWRLRLADYEVLAPFPQLDRPCSRPTKAEAAQRRLARAEGREVSFGAVLALQKRGWRPAEAEDGGVAVEMRKSLPGGLTASLPLDPGLYLKSPAENAKQTIGAAVVTGAAGDPMRLGDLDPVAFSELALDLAGLTA